MRCFRAPAAKVACERGLYTLPSDWTRDPESIDKVWSEYERSIAYAVERLIDRSIDAEAWARVLVPFVAGLLVRGPHWGQWFVPHLRQIGIESPADNINGMRLFAMQRLLGPVLVAKWRVLETRGEDPVITNDLGFTGFRNPSTKEMGLAVPLTLNHVLVLVPTRNRPVVIARNGKWFPLIHYARLQPDNHLALNSVIGAWARRFIFGPDEHTVANYLSRQPSPSPPLPPEPEFFGFVSGPLAAVHEFTWHRLVGVLSKHPESKDSWTFDVDWKAVAGGWHSTPIIPLNLPEFPPALWRIGDVIGVNFYDVEGFTTKRRD